MGKRNRRRRAEERGRTASGGASGPGAGRARWSWPRGLGRPDPRALFVTAARSLACSRARESLAYLSALHEAAPLLGRPAVGAAVADAFGASLEATFEHGWQPAELVRAVRRRASSRHADILVTAIAAAPSTASAQMPAAWRDQLGAVGAGRWWGAGADWLAPWAAREGLAWPQALDAAAEALGAVLALPCVELLAPPPSRWGLPGASCHQAEDPVLERVRALLAKAESTSFQPEAEALTAKAQELMARHAIDDAVAREAAGIRERPAGRRLAIDDPYAEAKSRLLVVVARTNGARCVWYRRYAMMAIVGFERDLDAIEVLFTSLLVQASRAMLDRGSVTDERGRSRTRSFRQSFLVAFAGRIAERLEEAAHAARVEAEGRIGSAVLPALVGRQQAVEEALAAMFPDLCYSRGPAVTNRDGWVAGRVAADMATLSPLKDLRERAPA